MCDHHLQQVPVEVQQVRRMGGGLGGASDGEDWPIIPGFGSLHPQKRDTVSGLMANNRETKFNQAENSVRIGR